jgi:hypothetical protein
MLVEIPDGFKDYFIKLLIEKMHGLQVNLMDLQDKTWEWQEKYIALSHEFEKYKKTHKKK